MGFLDKLKSIFGGAKEKAEQAMGGGDHAGHQHQQAASSAAAERDDEPEESPAEEEAFDVAGFDIANDEEAFFNAVLHMESEGQFGGTDESRAEIMQRFTRVAA